MPTIHSSDLDEDLVQRVFGSNIKRGRADAGLTQEQLAHRAGLDRSYVGQVERGERNVALVNIVRLARALDRTPADLMDGIAPEPVSG